MNSDYEHQRQIKEKLPHTWDALFARFGRFTEIQALAIEPLLDCGNCVLVSATASGKTEAALAPLIELLKTEGGKTAKKLSILYLAPTRALVRDWRDVYSSRWKNWHCGYRSKPATNLPSVPAARLICC